MSATHKINLLCYLRPPTLRKTPNSLQKAPYVQGAPVWNFDVLDFNDFFIMKSWGLK
jgi:hypothetical protein